MMRLRATLGMTALWMALSATACSSGDDGETTPSTETDGGSDSATDGAADTTQPDTSAPDTEAPDSETPDTETPDSEAPDTSGEDTDTPDTAVEDTGTPDTSDEDTGAPDTAGEDADTPDTAIEDSGTPAEDSGAPDTAVEDTGTPDTAIEDTDTPDTAIEDSGTPAEDSSAPDTAVEDTGTPDTAVTDGGSDASEPFYPPEYYVGSACTDDPDCYTNQYCSNGLYAVGAVDPTPVCVELSSTCTPSDDTIRFCDDDVGLCLSASWGAMCVPMCIFDSVGNMVQGCTGKNACTVEYFAVSGGAYYGIGQCGGGCSVDADCPTGNKCDPVARQCYVTCTNDATCATAWGSGAPSNWGCDVSRGACTFKYAKGLGQSCSSSSECPCLKSASAATGYCTQNCKTGVVGECAAGYTCDAFLPATTGSGATVFTGVPTGITGYCAKNCTTNADCPTGTICAASAGMTQKTCRPS